MKWNWTIEIEIDTKDTSEFKLEKAPCAVHSFLKRLYPDATLTFKTHRLED